MDLNLRGRSALITGGSKGIGLAIAKSLAAEGCHLHLAARTASELDKVAEEIRARHKVEVATHPADLSDSAQVKQVAAACRDIDILVNSAGGIPRGTLARDRRGEMAARLGPQGVRRHQPHARRSTGRCASAAKA